MIEKIKCFACNNIKMAGAILRRLNPPSGSNGMLKIYYGCGMTAQPGYVNIDIRWTPAVDVMGDLRWCANAYHGRVDEVFCSHVLEHYGYPGKALQDGRGSVLEAMKNVYAMLKPGGLFRIAVPDFSAIAHLYCGGNVDLYPALAGRICGEQDYPQNIHRCAFDQLFLERCLERVGFRNFQMWTPECMPLCRDASFDRIDGVPTSLNVLAVKQ